MKKRILQTYADSPDGQIQVAKTGTTLRYADVAGNTYRYDKDGNLLMFRGGTEAVNVIVEDSYDGGFLEAVYYPL